MGSGVKRCDCWIGRILDKTIPTRFQSSTLESYIPRDRKQAAAKEAIERNRFGSFFLWGLYDRGKTHLMFAQYRLLIETQRRRALVYTTWEIINELTEAEIKGTPSTLRLAVDSDRPLHLFWDDADKMKPTEFKAEVLFDLIDRLYRNQHALTVTSNLDLEALQTVLSPAIVSRIDRTCEPVAV